MDDKLFELITKMYSDISERLDKIESRFEDNSNELKSLGNQVTAFESDAKNDIKALYDGYKRSIELGEENNRLLRHINDKQDTIDIKTNIIKDKTEKIELVVERIEKDAVELSNKVEKQDVEIRVIKGVR